MAYQEPITKKRLFEFISLYRTVRITLVDNDEPIFVLTDMPDFEEQYTFVNYKIIIHRGKFRWKSDAKVPHNPQAEAYIGEKGGYYMDPYAADYDYPKQIAKEDLYRQFSIHNVILDKETKNNKYVKPFLSLLRYYGILEKIKQGNREGNDALQNNIIKFTGKETKDRKYIVRIGKKDLLISYPEYLLLFVLARKRKQDIHGDGLVRYESLRREKIVIDLNHLHHLVSSLKECMGRKDLVENYLKTGRYRLAITPDRIKISSPKSTEQTFRKIKKIVLKERKDREKAKKVRAQAAKNAPG